MPADLEVGVLLKPKNNLEDEVDDQEVDVGADGQRQTRGQQGGGGSFLGIGKAAVAVGLLAGILSQLRSVQETVGGVARTLNKLIAPALAAITQFIRPIIDKVLSALANFDVSQAISTAFGNIESTLQSLIQKLAKAIPGVDESNFNQDAPSGAVSDPEEIQELTPGGEVEFEGQQGTGGERNTEGQESSQNQSIFPTVDELQGLNNRTTDLQDEQKKEVFANYFQSKANEKS